MRDFDIPPPRRSRDERPTTPVDLPRRVPEQRAGVRTAYFGGTRDQVARVRSWCRCGMRMPAHRAFPILLVVSELVTNAVVHTASGGPCGRVRVSMETLPGQVVLVGVTDDGPRAQFPVTVPAPADRVDDADPNGRGLRLVAALAEKWWWTGCPGGPLTVWALVDPHRDPAA